MYLEFSAYLAMGGELDQQEFADREAWAEMYLDLWTLNRLQTVDWSQWESKVQRCVFKLVESYDAVMEAEGGSPVSHFSNGRDSFTFAEPLLNAPLHACYGFCVDVLPVELMSACVRYNEAN